MRVGLVALALVGCGRIGFQTRAGGDASADVVGDAPPCTAFGPWGAAAALTELNTPMTDYGGQITPDGLTYYFDSDRAGPEELYVATRPSRTAPFDPPVRLVSLDTGGTESDATPSADGLELIYNNSVPCLVHARRAATTDPFVGTATSICGSVGGFVTADGLTLYYNSALDTAAEGKLYVTTRATRADEFIPGSLIAELDSPVNKGFPALSADERTLYFESGNPLDLYETTRATLTSPWGAPAPIAGIDTPGFEEGDVSITADGTELFFDSTRGGSPDLYHATRSCQ